MRCKWLSIIVTAVFVFGLAGLSLAAQIVDINHWARPQIEKYLALGIVKGYPDDTFKPDSTITRAEFVTLVNRAFDKQYTGASASFIDIKPSDWFYQDIAAAQAGEYISGDQDGYFRPDSPVTRQEAAVIMAELLKLEVSPENVDFEDADSISQWAMSALCAVNANNIMVGYADGSFRPHALITRAETLVMLDRAMALLPPEAEQSKGLTGHVYIDGKPVENAVVKLFEKGRHVVINETNTAAGGEYAFAVDAGAYDITVAKDNYIQYVSNLILTDKLVKDITLIEGTVFQGVAVDSNSKPLKNTTLYFTTNPVFLCVTDDNGNFLVTVLPDGVYSISCGSGYRLITGVHSGGSGSRLLGTLRFPRYSSGGGGSGGGTPAVRLTSYSDADLSAASEIFNADSNTVYIGGTGLKKSNSFKVAYYDADGKKVYTEVVSADEKGGISSKCIFAQLITETYTPAHGLWHAAVYSGEDSPSIIYNKNDTKIVVQDGFTVEESAIPEFPAILASMVVAGMCGGIYIWMKKRKMVYTG
jgi:hypothetical protein